MMRYWYRHALGIMAILLIFISIAAAQEVEVVIPEDLTGSYTLSSEEGSFSEEDDVLRLSLSSAAEYANWVSTQPAVSGGRYETIFLMSDWAAAPEGTSTTALLTTDTQTIIMALSNPVLDDETGLISYDVEIESITPFDLDDKTAAELPASFGASTLFITIDSDFISNLQAGFEVRNSVRFITVTLKCTPFVTC